MTQQAKTTSVPKADAPDLAIRFASIRAQTLQLCEPLQKEDFVVQPITDVSPPKWHLGHTTWFFERFVLMPNQKGFNPFDERLHWFFNSYYESAGPRINRAMRGNMTRPTLDVVLEYRSFIDEAMGAFLSKPIADENLVHTITVGLQHEQQHQELLLTDLKYILGHNPLYPIYTEKTPFVSSNPSADWLRLEGGIYDIGYSGDGFCWDNEQSEHKVFIEPFQIRDRLVRNREYLEFINAGAYGQFQHWLMEGFEWIKEHGIEHPEYWVKEGEQWYEYTLQGLRPLNLDLPVTHISYYEADAFARWLGCRLPTEFEWEVACKQLQPVVKQNQNFQETGIFHPSTGAFPGDNQMLGHCWEWTSSAYAPYPRYPRFKGALGEYNGKFMVNQMVLRGGSCATPSDHMRITYRNFFHADKRWQFTGIRLVK